MSRDWKRTARTAGSFADDPAKEARRRVERALRSRKPTTARGKVVMEVGLLVAPPLVEQGVRLVQKKGPELARKGADMAKEKLPDVARRTKKKAKELRVKIRERRSRPSKKQAASTGPKPPASS
jgi:ElaB/YqjD/DUF883 family membrane-anchored ribosome-binding protein